MYSRLAFLAVASSAAFVAAGGPIGNPICGPPSSGYHLDCCDAIESFRSETVIFGIVVPAGMSVGLKCSPITAKASDSNTCRSQLACCKGATLLGGALVLDCFPITIDA